jgi:Fe-S-cluster containining protein
VKNKISILKKETFYCCQGSCGSCFYEGGCNLENDIKKYGLDKIKKLVYNE